MISVIFSTYNGTQTLPRMMDALCNIQEPLNGWEVIAIDNASTDDTYYLLQSYIPRLPLTVLQHSERGKNKALNFGLKYVTGELVVLTDDDIIPADDWLIQLEAAARKQPDFDIFGGAILPQWPSPPEKWILEYTPLGLTYALTAEDLQPGEIQPGLIWGPNMMVRKKIFEMGNTFDESVGPNAGSYIMGSETTFNIRMEKKGYRCYFTPNAKVSHMIRPAQMQRNWILRRAYRFGKNMYVQNHNRYKEKYPTIAGVPRWMISKFVLKSVEGLFKGAPFKTTQSFEAMWDVWHIAGYFSLAWKRLFDNK